MAFVDVHKIVTTTGMARVELVHYAAMLSRTLQITSVQALDMIENGEIGIDDLKEQIIVHNQTVKPVEPSEDEDEDTSP